jgi:RHS repeat-associated protein
MWGGKLSFPIKKFIALIVVILFGIININLVFSMQNVSLEYDSLGNLIVGKDNSYEYNSLNQLEKVYSSTGVLLEEYFYDESGSRIKKIEYLDGIQTTYYVGDFIRVVNSSGTFDQVYYYNSIQQVGKKDFDGEMYFYHPDHLGSTNLMTNSAGEIVEETRYLPFGAVIFGGDEKFLYTGKELDKTGLYYYGARYYDPFLRKFTQPDSVIPSVYNPQSLNKYSYVKNNPYKYIDPSGHFSIGAMWDSVVDTVTDATNYVADVAGDAYNSVMDFGTTVADAVAPVMDFIGNTLEMLPVSGDISDVWATFTHQTLFSQETLSESDYELLAVCATLPGVTYKNAKALNSVDDIVAGIRKSTSSSARNTVLSGNNVVKAPMSSAWKWNKGTFDTAKDSFKYHYWKHGYGKLSENAYLKKAVNLGKTIRKWTWKGYVRYDSWLNSGGTGDILKSKITKEKGLFDNAGKPIYYIPPK